METKLRVTNIELWKEKSYLSRGREHENCNIEGQEVKDLVSWVEDQEALRRQKSEKGALVQHPYDCKRDSICIMKIL